MATSKPIFDMDSTLLESRSQMNHEGKLITKKMVRLFGLYARSQKRPKKANAYSQRNSQYFQRSEEV